MRGKGGKKEEVRENRCKGNGSLLLQTVVSFWVFELWPEGGKELETDDSQRTRKVARQRSQCCTPWAGRSFTTVCCPPLQRVVVGGRGDRGCRLGLLEILQRAVPLGSLSQSLCPASYIFGI